MAIFDLETSDEMAFTDIGKQHLQKDSESDLNQPSG